MKEENKRLRENTERERERERETTIARRQRQQQLLYLCYSVTLKLQETAQNVGCGGGGVWKDVHRLYSKCYVILYKGLEHVTIWVSAGGS